MWGIEKSAVQVIKTRSDKLQYLPLTICSYDALTIKNILKQSFGFDVLFLDEAHYLRGKKARRTKYICGTDVRIKNVATKYAQQVVYLSGTPMLNRPRDLWPILRSAFPNDAVVADYYQYAYTYCAAFDGQWGMDDTGASNLDDLKAKYLDKFMLRMVKDDVVDLPEKVYVEIDIEMNQLAARKVKEERDLNLDIEMLSQGKAPIGEYASLRRELGLLKLSASVEHIQTILDQTGAVVVFTYHQELAKDIAKEFGTVPVIGSTPNNVRSETVANFQTNGGVFVGSYGAAGTGITLTKSSHVVLCELDYSPRIIDQAVDRCHRIGQKNNVTIHTLLWKEGLERTLYKQLQKKDQIFFNLFVKGHNESVK